MLIQKITCSFLVFVSLISSAQNKKAMGHLSSAPLSSSCIVTNLPLDKPDTVFHQHKEPNEPNEKDTTFFKHKKYLPNNSWNNYYENRNTSKLNKTNSDDFQIGAQKKYSIYYQGTPPDNTIAISNDGKIIASINVKIGFYDSTATRLIPNDRNIAAFINDSTLNQAYIYDPRVIYDQKADRFIYVVLSIDPANTSKVIIGFSQTNDPLGSWKFYTLAGNIDGSKSWFDYPNIALTDNELILTGNLYYSQNNDFNQAVIIQMNKINGYSGASSLKYKFWNNIYDAIGDKAFSIVPADNGIKQSYGPNFYLVSLSLPSSNVVSVYEISNLWNISSSQLKVKSINVDMYSVPNNDASQKGTTKLLDIKRNRIRSAYYANGFLHYTYITPTNTIGEETVIAYGRYDIATSSVKQLYIGETGINFAFPAIMHFSNLDSKNTTLLTYLASGRTIYPEIRCLSINENMQTSSSIQIKGGENYVNYNFGGSNNERWGDYTGITRKYNSNFPEIWVFGCYGETNNKWGNYLAQILAIKDSLPQPQDEDRFYFSPNPTMRYLDFNVYTSDTSIFEIKIYNSKGQLVFKEKTLIPAGNHFKTYDLIGLSPGEYIIKAIKDEKVVYSRLCKQDLEHPYPSSV